MTDAVRFRRNRQRAGRITLMCAPFVAGALYFLDTDLAAADQQGFPVATIAMATLACGLFGVVGAAAAWWAIRPGPALVVDGDGFVDRAGLVSVGRVGWDHVIRWQVDETRGQRFLSVYVVDPGAFTSRNPAVRMLQRANARLVGSPISLRLDWIRADEEDVLAALQDRCHRWAENVREEARAAKQRRREAYGLG